MQLHRAPSACSLAFVTVLAGCAATGPAIQQERDGLTWSAQRAADESKLIQSYLAHEFAPESDKATMQTRAVVLAQHAKEQAELVAAFKADGGSVVGWKAVAEALGAPADLIAQHSKPKGRTLRLLGQRNGDKS